MNNSENHNKTQITQECKNKQKSINIDQKSSATQVTATRKSLICNITKEHKNQNNTLYYFSYVFFGSVAKPAKAYAYLISMKFYKKLRFSFSSKPNFK